VGATFDRRFLRFVALGRVDRHRDRSEHTDDDHDDEKFDEREPLL
jgi:hypothetical protein